LSTHQPPFLPTRARSSSSCLAASPPPTWAPACRAAPWRALSAQRGGCGGWMMRGWTPGTRRSGSWVVGFI